MELNVLDLFSGIGGFSVGLEATGKFKTIGFCEQDKFCQKVLRKHWSDVPIYEDIKKLDAKKITADIITSGFPCQPISIAGKQKGKDDDRFLVPEMLRVVKEVKPRWFIAENVSSLWVCVVRVCPILYENHRRLPRNVQSSPLSPVFRPTCGPHRALHFWPANGSQNSEPTGQLEHQQAFTST